MYFCSGKDFVYFFNLCPMTKYYWEMWELISITGKREAGVFLSYPPYLWIQEEAEVDALSLRRKGEEARRDAHCDLWLFAAKTKLIQSILCILWIQLQDLWHTKRGDQMFSTQLLKL